MPKNFECCGDCQQTEKGCICAAVDSFFQNNRGLMEDLAEAEEKEKEQVKEKEERCLACFFAPCRCFGKKS